VARAGGDDQPGGTDTAPARPAEDRSARFAHGGVASAPGA
jgi:hypothetical protein